jgi:hypothetical protein
MKIYYNKGLEIIGGTPKEIRDTQMFNKHYFKSLITNQGTAKWCQGYDQF